MDGVEDERRATHLCGLRSNLNAVNGFGDIELFVIELLIVALELVIGR